MTDIQLVQPRHSYAPESGLGHIYLPTSLLTVAARVLATGCNVKFCDENMVPAVAESDLIGINIVGSPYIPVVRALWSRLRQSESRCVLGGQVVSGFSPDQLSWLFGESVVNGNIDEMLCRVLNIPLDSLPSITNTSLIAAYELIGDHAMAAYLSNEFCLFLSKGCRYTCSFCAAERTRRTADGKIHNVRETYRDLSVVERDLVYLASRAARLGIDRLQIYLSNLDLFQTPSALQEFAERVQAVRLAVPGVSLAMRGLSTAQSFLDVHATNPELLRRLNELGLLRVGFGVDGAAPAVWRATRKPQSGSMCTDAIALAATEYGLIPETLMVFGHADVDTRESLRLAVDFTKEMWDSYGSLPRPHVAKAVVPGNDGWRLPSSNAIITELLESPEEFQALDFTAAPSRLTHSDPTFRSEATASYLEACSIEGAITQFVLPVLREFDPSETDRVRRFNMGRYDI